MVERVGRRFNLRPQRLAGDTVYGAVRLLKWLVDRKITPHVPVWDKSARPDGAFSRTDFTFDRERNVHICPGGSELTSTGNIDQGHILYYMASKTDCSICSSQNARRRLRARSREISTRMCATASARWPLRCSAISGCCLSDVVAADASLPQVLRESEQVAQRKTPEWTRRKIHPSSTTDSLQLRKYRPPIHDLT
jgi:hypothetical protein